MSVVNLRKAEVDSIQSAMVELTSISVESLVEIATAVFQETLQLRNGTVRTAEGYGESNRRVMRGTKCGVEIAEMKGK